MSDGTYRIRLLLPYYGNWPVYFRLFLESCRHNSQISFLFITDLHPPSDYPPNVTFQHLRIEDLFALVEKKTGVKVPVSTAYKLCDFKPMYGDIFSNLLDGYDFWGCGDIDVIYGNISKFVTAEILDKHDIISFREHWLSGAFVLYRNTVPTNSLYKTSRSLLKVLQSRECLCFDECLGEFHRRLERGETIFNLDKNESMTWLVKKASQNGTLRAFFQDLIIEDLHEDECICWHSGSVKRNDGNEYLLIHFVNLKYLDQFSFPAWSDPEPVYYITRTGFYKPHEFEGKIYKMRIYWRKILGVKKRLGRLPLRLKKMFCGTAKSNSHTAPSTSSVDV